MRHAEKVYISSFLEKLIFRSNKYIGNIKKALEYESTSLIGLPWSKEIPTTSVVKRMISTKAITSFLEKSTLWTIT